VPQSCANEKQQLAIHRAYCPLVQAYGLPPASTQPVPKSLADAARRKAILGELRQSEAKILVLLGDQPIKWFLHHFDNRRRRLSDFQPYGALHDVAVDGLKLKVLPLVHPRQAAQLGRSSPEWALADAWERVKSPQRHRDIEAHREGKGVEHAKWRRITGVTEAVEGKLSRKERRKGLGRLVKWLDENSKSEIRNSKEAENGETENGSGQLSVVSGAPSSGEYSATFSPRGRRTRAAESHARMGKRRRGVGGEQGEFC
jgi:hypothetical protein